MERPELGRVEPVDVRGVWPHESDDFTPWLAKNLDLLGEALHMKLKLVQPEAPVGPYYLDIQAKEIDRDVMVAIENQLEWTDLTHLGQLLTYATGCGAHIAIWVAPEFRYEHAEALHRLNEWTRDEIEFYGVQIGVIRIGDSSPAPVFRSVVSPGCWNKDITQPPSETMSPKDLRFHHFFQPLIGELIGTCFADKATQYFDSSGRLFSSSLDRGVGYAVSFWKNAAWVTLHIRMEDDALTKRIFDELKKDQEQIERCVEGQKWDWHRYDEFLFSSISLRRDGCSIDDQPEKLAETREWMLGYLPKLKEVMDHRLKGILAELASEGAAST